MKYLVVLLASCCVAFGGTHKIVVKFDSAVDPAVVFSGLDVVSWRQQGNRPVYKLVVNSSMTRRDVLSQIYEGVSVASAEDNQTSAVGTLEAVAQVDGRVIASIDDVASYAIVNEDPGFVNSRVIFVLDGSGTEFASLYNQYHMTEVRAHYAWEYASGLGITVAVLDTGADMNHPFLVDNLVHGYDFVDEDGSPDEVQEGLDSNNNGHIDEGYGHGTHVAGILKTIAPDVSIMPIRVADSDGQADLFNILQGLNYAIDQGVHVINLSLSVMEPSSLLVDALDRARDAGIVVVTSAGNENSTQLMFPATESEVITVTALTSDREKAAYANYSRKVDVAAPGDSIISAMPGGGYVARSGTSMSSPIVAAQAAIVFELVPNASVQYVHHRVTNFVISIQRENSGVHRKLGKGLADVWDSITVQSLN